MKKLMVAAMTATAFAAFADEPKAENKAPVEAEQAESAPLIWGFGSSGIYSGYQLYGSLLNSEPTWQTYAEGNLNLPWDIGSVGVGLWFNSDLTDKRHGLYGKAFNEYDPNVHFDHTFWFDDDKTWGLAYRTEVVWYIYPQHRGHHGPWSPFGGSRNSQNSVSTPTTMDWNHYFELKNPYVTPYFKWVHEYHENKANLWLAGLKKTIAITDSISITPTFETVYRSHRYNWCFPTDGWEEATHGSGFASQRIGFDLNWQFAANFGVFAKLYYCHIYDHSLRAAAEHGSGADYGQYKDFAWGGVGVTWNF